MSEMEPNRPHFEPASIYSDGSRETESSELCKLNDVLDKGPHPRMARRGFFGQSTRSVLVLGVLFLMTSFLLPARASALTIPQAKFNAQAVQPGFQGSCWSFRGEQWALAQQTSQLIGEWWQDLQADYGQYPVPTGGSTPGPTQDQFARAQADMAKLHRLINNHRRRTGLEWDVVRDAIRYGVDPNVSGPATWAVSRLFGALYYLDVASSDEYHQTNTGLDDYHTAQTFMSNTWDALKQLPCQATSSTAPTATQQQINEIRGGQHGPLPPAQPSGSCSGSGNVVSMTVLNKTPYRLSLWIAGPTERSLTIDPGASTSLQLPPGSYEVAGKVPSTNVLPFYGTWNLGSGCSYEDDFYVQ